MAGKSTTAKGSKKKATAAKKGTGAKKATAAKSKTGSKKTTTAKSASGKKISGLKSTGPVAGVRA